MKLARHVGWCAVALALLLLPDSASATPKPVAPSRVSVLTMGPGEHPFTRFGHNAILLEWDAGGRPRNLVYNFGTFEFDGLQGVVDFLAGRFRYWLSVSNLEQTLRVYAAEQRSLTAQELELTPSERSTLAALLERNALPAHRYYAYDYYRDNCSTRVRDVLDRLLRGQLHASVRGPGHLTYREHTLRLVGDSAWLYAGLELALGAPTDAATTRWQELFLPDELHRALAHASRTLPHGRVPLVRTERTLLSSARAQPPPLPPDRRLSFASGGLLLGLIFAGLGGLARRSRGGRLALGSASTAAAGLSTAIGAVLTWFWFCSEHWATYRNASLLSCPPWAVALVVSAVGLVLNRAWAARGMLVSAALMALGAVVGLTLGALEGGGRGAQALALFFLPLWAGVAWGSLLLLPAKQSPRVL